MLATIGTTAIVLLAFVVQAQDWLVQRTGPERATLTKTRITFQAASDARLSVPVRVPSSSVARSPLTSRSLVISHARGEHRRRRYSAGSLVEQEAQLKNLVEEFEPVAEGARARAAAAKIQAAAVSVSAARAKKAAERAEAEATSAGSGADAAAAQERARAAASAFAEATAAEEAAKESAKQIEAAANKISSAAASAEKAGGRLGEARALGEFGRSRWDVKSIQDAEFHETGLPNAAMAAEKQIQEEAEKITREAARAAKAALEAEEAAGGATSASANPDLIKVPGAALLGLFAGSGISCILLRFRRS
eukprot:gnl/TRDRNA2_/TRDRNA2_89956_c0_seq1.p1 gnl/TRDRNA2_/TRDRNA2_89956_c0~~gnl/TRDRNA2_/TRDRNA2_89956_c0_seq1.p1  ORF type:complete len:308 (+),score=52.75 gnl/TRDRNA2_/TRDRNA2_89956_c0_seq1:35-958(+)